MLAGSLIVSHITTTLATWSALLILLAIHLCTNYLAVRAVTMRTINRQRANLVFSSYLESSYDPSSVTTRIRPENAKTLRPREVSSKERIFERDGVIRWNGSTIIGRCVLGVALKAVFDTFPQAVLKSQTGSYAYRIIIPTGKTIEGSDRNISIEELFKLFVKENYMLWFSHYRSGSSYPFFLIVLNENASTKTQLKAWFHAFLCAWRLRERIGNTPWRVMEILKETLANVNDCWDDVLKRLEEAGWDTENGALETRSGTRVRVGSGTKRD